MRFIYRLALIISVAISMMLSGAGIATAEDTDPAPASTSQMQAGQSTAPIAEPKALPVIGLPVILACVGTVGLSAYQAYKGGDPVEYVASAVIGCIPFGAAAKPAVVGLIKSNPAAVANVLRTLGAGALASSLCGDAAGC